MGRKIDWYVGSGDHGMRRDTCEAIYAWMNRWLKGLPGKVSERTIRSNSMNLYVTATGQVATALGKETASTLNMKRFSQINRSRAANSRGHRPLISPGAGAPKAQSNETATQRTRLEYLTYESEPGRYVSALLCSDEERVRNRTAVYVNQQGKDGFPAAGDAEQCALDYTVLAWTRHEETVPLGAAIPMAVRADTLWLLMTDTPW
jgi:hypothetical protein